MRKKGTKIILSCFLILTLVAALGLSCGNGDEPTPTPTGVSALFTATPTLGKAPLQVQFTDQSTGDISTFAWDFGDGSTSTDRNPLHTFSAVGTYTVSLTVTGTGGATDTETKADFIRVGDLLAGFTGTPTSGNPPLTVQFTDDSVGTITAYEWDFDSNGTIDSTEQNPSHVYDSIGTYSVSLKVTGEHGSDAFMRGDYIVVSSAEEVIFKIGHVTDFTGPASEAMINVNYSIEDLTRYYNAENLIPGVTMEVIHYDNQYDTSRDIPAYEWLRERGAQIIITGLPPVPVTLKTFVDDDKFMLFSMNNNTELVEPPGYVYTMNVPHPCFAQTVLKWAEDNDPNFPTGRKVKLGGAGWVGPYQAGLQQGLTNLATAYPDTYEVVGLYQTMYAVTWDAEVAALLDCDYIIPPSTSYGMTSFITQYRAAGGQATFVTSDAHPSYLGMAIAACGWDAIDGTLGCFVNGWWNDAGFQIVDLAQTLVHAYHDNAEEIIAAGMGYIGSFHLNSVVLTMLAGYLNSLDNKADYSGEGFNTFASTFSGEWTGYEPWAYTATKRWPFDYVGLYLWSETVGTLTRHATEWLPAVYLP